MDPLNKESIEKYFSERYPFCKAGKAFLEKVEIHSRNTILYRIISNGERFVGKYSVLEEQEVSKKEFDQLLEMKNKIAGEGIRSLTPVAYYEDTGILVTKEEPGRPLDELVILFLKRRQNNVLEKRMRSIMKMASRVLYRFHMAYGKRRESNNDIMVKHYLDYSPGNLLIQETGEIVLLDPPKSFSEGSPFFDVGTFCFELSRCYWKALRFSTTSRIRINKLKETFIREYVESWDEILNVKTLDKIRHYEMIRADTVLGYYRKYGSYNNRAKEFFRYCLYSPIIQFHKKYDLPKSYLRMKKHIHE